MESKNKPFENQPVYSKQVNEKSGFWFMYSLFAKYFNKYRTNIKH
jgi:hypothetical protein